MTTVLKRGVYVAVGAADLVAEKMREMPVLDNLRGGSLLETARDIEPKLRKRADELSKRGETTVARVRTRFDQARDQVQQLPDEAAKQFKQFRDDPRKQVEELRTDARKQAREIRSRIEKAFAGNATAAKAGSAAQAS